MIEILSILMKEQMIETRILIAWLERLAAIGTVIMLGYLSLSILANGFGEENKDLRNIAATTATIILFWIGTILWLMLRAVRI